MRTLLLLCLMWTGCRATGGSDAELSWPTEAQRLNALSPWARAQGEPGWRFDVAAGVEAEPDYAGSDDYEIEPTAFAQALYESTRGHRYYVNIGEVGAWWRLGDEWVLGTVFEYEEGRENDNDALNGLASQDDTLVAEITIAKRLGDFTLGAVLQPDVLGRGKGFETFLVGGYDTMLTKRLRFSVYGDVSFGDAEHMRTEFGISPGESVASGLAAYDPGAGLKSTGIEIGLEHFFTERLSLLFSGEVEYYFSEAADSPLIADRGSEVTFEAGLVLRYSW